MCARELPELDAVRREHQAAARFVAVSLEPDEKEVRDAADRMGLEMQIAFAEGEVLGPLGVNQVPSVAFIDSEGVVVAAASGERSRSFLEKRVRELAATAPARAP